jgi:hypothetical protein
MGMTATWTTSATTTKRVQAQAQVQVQLGHVALFGARQSNEEIPIPEDKEDKNKSND